MMNVRLAVAMLPIIALAGCGGDGAANNSVAAAPVAAAPAPAGQNWTETVVETPEGGFRVGNPAAAVKLIEYGSRTCPTCGAFGREASQPLFEKYIASGKVSFEFRDFLVHGAPDLAAALLGQCGGPAPFFPLLEQMYVNQNEYLGKLQTIPQDVQQRLAGASPITVATTLGEQMGLIDFVKQRGVPETQARACLADQAKLEKLAKQSDAAAASGTVTGTPTFLLNGDKLNAVSWSDVEKALKGAGA